MEHNLQQVSKGHGIRQPSFPMIILWHLVCCGWAIVMTEDTTPIMIKMCHHWVKKPSPCHQNVPTNRYRHCRGPRFSFNLSPVSVPNEHTKTLLVLKAKKHSLKFMRQVHQRWRVTCVPFSVTLAPCLFKSLCLSHRANHSQQASQIKSKIPKDCALG